MEVVVIVIVRNVVGVVVGFELHSTTPSMLVEARILESGIILHFVFSWGNII